MSEQTKLPIQRHPYCKVDRCEICLEDCLALNDYLFERTGLQRRFHDMLGEYRAWLDSYGILAESPSGWALPTVFQEKNVEAFIAEQIGRGAEASQ